MDVAQRLSRFGAGRRPTAAYDVLVPEGQVMIRRADEPRPLRKNPVGG